MKTRLISSAAVLAAVGSIFVSASPPKWWGERVGIDSDAPSNPKAVATIGQLKNMAHHLHAEMEVSLPGGAGFALQEVFPAAPSDRSEDWKRQQSLAANLGQLKAVAHPFYEQLRVLAPGWLDEQMDRNGLDNWSHDYPWDPATPVEENYKPATIGQLKLVFSLRLGEDLDEDLSPDLIEILLYGDTETLSLISDFDGDGLTDREEILGSPRTSPFTSDTDYDGRSDFDEKEDGTDPLVPDVQSPLLPVTELVMLTPLQ